MSVAVTGVMLNWKRPGKVRRILNSWKRDGVITEAIVWNNNKDAPFEHDWAKVINSDCDMGLYTRFAAMALASNECVVIQDDDLLVPVTPMGKLINAWTKDPNIIHGIYGRGPRPDGSYAITNKGDKDSPVVLTRILVARRTYAGHFFAALPRFNELQEGSIPYGNGEDIIFSYVVRKATGRLNRVHPVAAKEMRDHQNAIFRRWPGHMEHRTKIMRACEAWLKE